jgi:hypothetical protein
MAGRLMSPQRRFDKHGSAILQHLENDESIRQWRKGLHC